MNYDIYNTDAWGQTHRTGELRSIDGASYDVYKTDAWGQLHRNGQLRVAGGASSAGGGFLWIVLLPFLIIGSCFSHHEPGAENSTYRAPQSQVVEYAEPGPIQAEKDANWQRIVDMRAAAVRAPRAELVRLPHHRTRS